ncbi:acyl-CoA dehydrogenase family protein [Peterkaempfera bronchialis]|uniref:Oxidoreductase n=1 Tax=Peterkaempfera bronchialis TaxID=2126346 RepID=A0A345SU57_9ACTN|nr:acyl-CoA dehydrogenase family protein [Peterkaempfera bronchialis]AXI77262.1 oxidoreductase [Peterkaempfera bronchialis]
MTLDTGSLTALARTWAEDIEHQRRLTPGIADAITTAGFARHFVPKQWNGSAGSFAEAAEAAAVLGETCTSGAWCAALYAAHGRLAAYLPYEGQRELWAESPDIRIAAAIVPPSGETEVVADGWMLTGTWNLASGVDHAHWILLAAWVGEGAARACRIFAVPRARFEVADTWHSLGLRGTGSNTVRVERTFVPAHRTFTLGDLAHTEPGRERCHSVPYLLVAGAQFVAPALGAARQALRDWTELTRARVLTDGRPAHATPGAQEVLARASGEVHAAGLLVRHALGRADLADITEQAVAENVRDFSLAAEMSATAVDRLMRAAGSRAQAVDSPLQRRWRDVVAATGHAALGFEAASALYSRTGLGPPRASG